MSRQIAQQFAATETGLSERLSKGPPHQKRDVSKNFEIKLELMYFVFLFRFDAPFPSYLSGCRF